MSVEEDTELRDLVSQTLENNGVLAKIRAQLRASVFLALEEQETNMSKAPFENKALKEFLKSPQGALGMCIVREFLEYLELDFTLSVYNTETSHGRGYDYSGRNKLIKDLHVRGLNGKKGPLLAHILQIAQDSCGPASDIKQEIPLVNADHIKSSPDESLLHNSNVDDATYEGSPDASPAPLDRTFTSEGTMVKEILSTTSTIKDESTPKILQSYQQPVQSEPLINLDQSHDMNSQDGISFHGKSLNAEDIISSKSSSANLSKDSSIKIDVSKSGKDSSSNDRMQDRVKDHIDTKTMKKEGSNSMTSLNELPPLDGVHKRRNANHVGTINFSDLDLSDEYEEDFLSTDSSAAGEVKSKSCNLSQRSSSRHVQNGKENAVKSREENKETSDKVANSPIASVSEDLEDENTNSGVEDLLNSTASTENTVDATISHIQSNFADHIEEL